jgi:predicted alpha/beta superfamily hydrolase
MKPHTETVPVRFEVEVPADTPVGEKVWLAGSSACLGNWKAAGVRLERATGNLWVREVRVRKNSLVFYKATLGSWERVEKTTTGEEVLDRELIARGPVTVNFKVDRWADGKHWQPTSTRDAHVIDLGNFGRALTGFDHKVLVHVPPGYEATGAAHYPILYMLDGQNVFDGATAFLGQAWDADNVHDELVSQNKVRPFFIAAIYHANQRDRFYTPVKDTRFGGGDLELTARLILDELDPVLRERFRIEEGGEFTGICGSSLGGLAAFHLGWRYPERFGVVGAISPSLWWAHYSTMQLVRAYHGQPKPNRYWLDIGTHESEMLLHPVREVTELADVLADKGFNVALEIDEKARHTESAWKKRLPIVFQWMFGDRPGRK